MIDNRARIEVIVRSLWIGIGKADAQEIAEAIACRLSEESVVTPARESGFYLARKCYEDEQFVVYIDEDGAAFTSWTERRRLDELTETGVYKRVYCGSEPVEDLDELTLLNPINFNKEAQ